MANPRREQKRAAAQKSAQLRAKRERLKRQIARGAIAGGVVLLVGLLLVSLVSGGGSSSDNAASTTTTSPAVTSSAGGMSSSTTGTQSNTVTTNLVREMPAIESKETCPANDGSSPRRTSFKSQPPVCIDPTHTYIANFDTDQGRFSVQLDPQSAPLTVNNFVFLARWHYYDGLIFHRVLQNFVIQGGDPNGTGSGGPGYKFEDELPTGKYQQYDIAMANSGPDTNGSQFFIVLDPTGNSLQPNYSKFGKVFGDREAVDKIAKGPYGNSIPKDQAHKINSINIQEIVGAG